MKYTSQIFAEARGSIGGCTFSRNRFGLYTRNRAVPINPSSSRQQTMRGAMATLVARWTGTLTSAQRNGWETWAENTPTVDKLGNPINLTGQNAYIQANSGRIQVGLSVVDDAPVIFAGAVLTPPNLTALDETDGSATYSFTNTDEWATAVGGALVVFGGAPQNPSVNFFKGPFRFFGLTLGAVVPPASPVTFDYPYTLAAGQRGFVRFRAYTADGRISTAWFDNVLVTP